MVGASGCGASLPFLRLLAGQETQQGADFLLTATAGREPGPERRGGLPALLGIPHLTVLRAMMMLGLEMASLPFYSAGCSVLHAAGAGPRVAILESVGGAMTGPSTRMRCSGGMAASAWHCPALSDTRILLL